MRKLLLVMLLFVIVMVSGCNSKEYVCSDGTVVADPSLCQQQEPQEEAVVVSPPEEIVSEQPLAPALPLVENPSFTLSDNDKKILDEKLNKDPVVMAKTVMEKGLSVGETYIFPFGFKNNKNDKREYQVTYLGLDGKTKSNSNAGNDDTIVSWLSKTPRQDFYTLDKNERMYIPIVVTVNDIINQNGKKTVPGTYKFMVKVGQRQQGEELYDELGTVMFYVRVD